MKIRCPALTFLALLTLASPASASVTYEMDAFLAGFQYTAPDFITTTTTVPASQTSYCGVFIFGCQSLTFTPASSFGSSTDDVTLNLALFPLLLADPVPEMDPPSTVPVTFSFAEGALGQAGTYQSTNQWATLTVTANVSAVPLPASASLFGAAVLTLGLVGVRRARRRMPA